VSRSRQLNWNFSSDRRIDRAMLVGVLLGFVGVAMNAYVIAQITVQ